MPRESVDNRWYGKPVRHVVSEGAPSVPDGPPDNAHIDVGWTKGQRAVQVGIVRPTDTPDDEQMWLDLDREGLNDLIRLLQRARDSSFGRDA